MVSVAKTRRELNALNAADTDYAIRFVDTLLAAAGGHRERRSSPASLGWSGRPMAAGWGAAGTGGLPGG